MVCASHAERVAQRWEGLEQRIGSKISSLGLNGKAVERLLTQAIRSGTKAKKIMWLRRAAEAVATQALPHAACRQGCTHCCHIAVVVTKAEALQIAAETGCYVNAEAGKPPPLEAGDAKDGNAAHWQGVPCSFLKEGDCSIYHHRPLACRLQLNMDDDDLLCQLVEGESIRVPYLNLTAHHITAVVALGMGQPIADIREWFPRGGMKMEEAWNGINPFTPPNPIQTMDHLAAVLGDTLELLAEVSDYLSRLPHVPATKELINKIEAHQTDPGALTAMRIAKQIEAESQSRVVGLYTPAGLPLMEVEVHGDMVRLKIGPEPIRRGALRRLEQGQEFRLQLHDKKEHFALLGR